MVAAVEDDGADDELVVEGVLDDEVLVDDGDVAGSSPPEHALTARTSTASPAPNRCRALTRRLPSPVNGTQSPCRMPASLRKCTHTAI